jgi:hypothetical protein
MSGRADMRCDTGNDGRRLLSPVASRQKSAMGCQAAFRPLAARAMQTCCDCCVYYPACSITKVRIPEEGKAARLSQGEVISERDRVAGSIVAGVTW